MTRETPGPDIELLAALDAGLLDPERARSVRCAAEADPAAAHVLQALAATRAELAAEPDLTVPPEVAARWAAALAAEGPARPPSAADSAADLALEVEPPNGTAGPPASGSSRATTRPRPGDWTGRVEPRGRGSRRATPAPRPNTGGRYRSRWWERRHPLAAAAALAALLAGAVLFGRPAAPDSVRLSRVDLAAVGTAAVGVTDVGELIDPTRRAACLRAAAPIGLPPDAPLLGGRHVLLDGRPGILLVLPGGELGRFRLVVVDPACGPDGGSLLAETTVGR